MFCFWKNSNWENKNNEMIFETKSEDRKTTETKKKQRFLIRKFYSTRRRSTDSKTEDVYRRKRNRWVRCQFETIDEDHLETFQHVWLCPTRNKCEHFDIDNVQEANKRNQSNNNEQIRSIEDQKSNLIDQTTRCVTYEWIRPVDIEELWPKEREKAFEFFVRFFLVENVTSSCE